MPRVFYGWWVVVAGFLLQTLGSVVLIQGFTAYFVPLQSEFRWSRAAVAGAFSMTRAESGLLGPIEGWAIDRFGPRPVVLAGIILLGLGFLLFSQVHSISNYYVAFVVIALGSSLGGFTPVTAAIANWFLRKRSLAMGISMSGLSAGGLLVPVATWSIVAYGWRPTAIAMSIAIWLIGIPAALVLRQSPEKYGLLPDGATGGPVQAGAGEALGIPREDQDFTARQALKTSAFWMLALGHACALLVVGAVSIHQVPHMVDQVGVSLQFAGGIVALMSFMVVIGQIGGGYLGDRLNKRALIIAAMAGHSAGLLALALATSTAHLVLYAVFHGLAWGVRPPLLQSLRVEYFGRVAFATILGFSHVVTMAAMTGAPLFAGWMADLQDSYRMPFTVLAIMAALGSVFFFFARAPQPGLAGTANRLQTRRHG